MAVRGAPSRPRGHVNAPWTPNGSPTCTLTALIGPLSLYLPFHWTRTQDGDRNGGFPLIIKWRLYDFLFQGENLKLFVC